jgi:FAD/FMN-containing dehydrogenase
MSTLDNLLHIVGNDYVVGKGDNCMSFSHDGSFVSGEVPSCVVKPNTAEQVQKIVQQANKDGFSLIPVSSRGPRFRGDTVPEKKDTVIVDLSSMNSIVRIDRRSKTAIVEPGVTFGELIDAAAAQGLRVAMPLMPRSTKSVVGSLLEREPTTMPKYHWDMQDPLCCVEVIFGSGDSFRTGSAAGPGSLEEQWGSGQAQKSPMGPAQTDLAKIIQGSQGTMGIVTWASVKLEVKPQAVKAFIVGASNLNDLIEFSYALTRKKYADHCFILNNVNCASIRNSLSDTSIPEWLLFYTIAGYDYFPEERVQYLEKDIADIAEKMRVEPSKKIGSIDADEFSNLIQRPSSDPYWKLRKTNGFEDILFLNSLERSHEFINELHHEMKSAGISKDNVGIYLQPVQHGRVCHYEFSVMYNPADKEESKKVRALCDSMTKKIMDKGGFFSRPYAQSAQMIYSKCPDSVAALKKVKNILDPRGVMNPGKLCFK